MGFELTCFVSEVDKEFVCSICMMVVEKPLESPCEHIFCAKCIEEWVTLETICPVDRQVLRMGDLKTTPRYYRNLLNKLEVRCEMESLGCQSIVPLENLKTHVNNCTYKPDAIVVCDKGCNLTMTRLDYQKSCITHLSVMFVGQIEEMKTQIESLSNQVKRQREIMVRLMNKSIPPSKLAWIDKSRNMKTSADEPNILEPISSDGCCFAFAQFPRLDASNYCFKICVLSIMQDQYIVIGLTPMDQHEELLGHKVGSIGYYSKGEIVINGRVEFGFQQWKNDDICECGVIFPDSSLNAEFGIGEVYFSINQEIIVKKKMTIPKEGLFPTIRMGSFTESVPKIEYLTE